MDREYYKITYRDKGFNYKEPFSFKCYDMDKLDAFIDRFLERRYCDIKVYHVVENKKLIKEVN